MAYQKIDLVGGEYHGRECTTWAGEGVFPVWPDIQIEAANLVVDDGPPQTVAIRRPVNYSVRCIRVNGWLFTYAAPADMPDEAALRYLFPNGGRPCP
jgi:hypothetical protein